MTENCHRLPELADIRLSVALVTRNHPESLERCLKSWRSQTVAPIEIVLSDDSDPEYVEKMRALAEKFDCLYVEGPRRGLYANRNCAALACSGTHILTGDDDHTHPTDYVEKALAVAAQDPGRVWIFGELSTTLTPDYPLQCPPELSRSGHGCYPRDTSNCSAIADGSSVYPRQIFDSGLRYDDTYPFGTIYYLWGKMLVANGWRISYSDKTHIYHHQDLTDRKNDVAALKQQLECMTYVSVVNALWINRSISNLFWALAYLARRMLFMDSIVWFDVRTRISPVSVCRLISRAWTFPQRNARLRSGGKAESR